ncbi:MAG: dipeptidase [Gemmatimonadota bacterium]|nr:dipeptidase [Gemmatimonadota bacterium]MDP6803356.1 dipeptidase [Gemmatimonadota bacterium]MDP7032631.1 dipeptidase [Gemmatimonadota bacterium]
MESVIRGIEKSKEHSVRLLEEFLRIPSISTDADHQKDVLRAAEYLAGVMRESGVPGVEILPTDGHPIVYGEWCERPDAPTLLIYGHYDVQPVTDPSIWTSPPFEPAFRDGKIWARGATDDKGQLLVHVLAAREHLKANGSLPVNVKFLFEGEEEIGSEHLDAFLRENTGKLACDAVVISDTAMFAPGVPSICTGLRGIAYVEFTLRGASADMHSGSFGGGVDNPALALSRVLAGLKDAETGRILVDGFYDEVEEPSDEEKRGWSELPHSDEDFREMTGVPRLYGESGRTTLERLWSRPTLDVNGIWGGFTGEGSMTVLPARASAKVSMRLVPGQDPAVIVRRLRKHLEEHLPSTVVLEEFQELHGGKPWIATQDHPAVQAAFAAVEKGFGTAPVATREGGSIPIVHSFAEILSAPVVLMGIGLHDEGAHGPDEHLDLANYQAGIRSAAHLLSEVAVTLGSVPGRG